MQPQSSLSPLIGGGGGGFSGGGGGGRSSGPVHPLAQPVHGGGGSSSGPVQPLAQPVHGVLIDDSSGVRTKKWWWDSTIPFADSLLAIDRSLDVFVPAAGKSGILNSMMNDLKGIDGTLLSRQDTVLYVVLLNEQNVNRTLCKAYYRIIGPLDPLSPPKPDTEISIRLSLPLMPDSYSASNTHSSAGMDSLLSFIGKACEDTTLLQAAGQDLASKLSEAFGCHTLLTGSVAQCLPRPQDIDFYVNTQFNGQSSFDNVLSVTEGTTRMLAAHVPTLRCTLSASFSLPPMADISFQSESSGALFQSLLVVKLQCLIPSYSFLLSICRVLLLQGGFLKISYISSTGLALFIAAFFSLLSRGAQSLFLSGNGASGKRIRILGCTMNLDSVVAPEFSAHYGFSILQSFIAFLDTVVVALEREGFAVHANCETGRLHTFRSDPLLSPAAVFAKSNVDATGTEAFPSSAAPAAKYLSAARTIHLQAPAGGFALESSLFGPKCVFVSFKQPASFLRDRLKLLCHDIECGKDISSFFE